MKVASAAAPPSALCARPARVASVRRYWKWLLHPARGQRIVAAQRRPDPLAPVSMKGSRSTITARPSLISVAARASRAASGRPSSSGKLITCRGVAQAPCQPNSPRGACSSCQQQCKFKRGRQPGSGCERAGGEEPRRTSRGESEPPAAPPSASFSGSRTGRPGTSSRLGPNRLISSTFEQLN